MATRVQEWGLLPPTQNADLVWAQLRAAHRYYNKRVELERARMAEIRRVQSAHAEIGALEAARDDAWAAVIAHRTEIKASRAEGQRRDIVQDRVRTAELKAVYEARKIAVREAKVAARAELKAEFERIAAQGDADVKAARNASGLYWGSYLLVDQAIEAALEATKPKVGRPTSEMRFKRWSGGGTVGVQLQNGFPVESLMAGEGTQIRIDPIDPAAFRIASRGERRRQTRSTLHLRVGSDEKRHPIWASWPLQMSRPIPAGAAIKWAKVILRPGPHPEWVLQLTYETADPEPTEAPESYVAVDLGWRAFGDEFRIAYTVASDGQRQDVRLPPSIMARVALARRIQGYRDDLFNQVRDEITPVVKGLTLSDELKQHVKMIANWHSIARLAGLIRRLKAEPGDDPARTTLIERLKVWRRRDMHLWQYQEGARKHAYRHRRDIYRNLACALSRRYQTLILEDMNLAEMKEHAPPEEGPKVTTPADVARDVVAPGELRLQLAQAFRARGGKVVLIPAEYTTRICSWCAYNNVDVDTAKSVVIECEGCGRAWDQDENAARNLAASGRTRIFDAAPEAPKKRSNRWAARKEKKQPA